MTIHSLVENSRVNGPGNRFVIWTQGCKKKCKNCFNPLTWSARGIEISSYDLFLRVKNSGCSGVTLTGGDPLEQPDELLEFLVLLSELDLEKGIILFTGYTLQEIKDLGGSVEKCLSYVDLLIDGRYEEDLFINSSLRGSSNQNYYYFSSKLEECEILIDHSIEVGSNYITGFPSFDKKILKEFGIVLS